MKRTNKEFKVDAILIGDMHIHEETKQPICRTDNYWEAQWEAVYQIKKLQEKYNCIIYNGGDVLDHWKSSPHLLNTCIKNFPKKMFTVIGNHDLPSHQMDSFLKSGLSVLMEANAIKHLQGQGDWETDLKEIEPFSHAGRKIIVSHMMTWDGELPWPGCEDPKANKLFKIFSKADLILTSHNHTTFAIKKKGRLIINPGSMMQYKSDQLNHRPAVFLYNAELNDFKIHYLKINKDVISREHIEIAKHKEERAVAFIEKLKDSWDIGLSFEENIEKAIQENNIPKKMQIIILNWMGL